MKKEEVLRRIRALQAAESASANVCERLSGMLREAKNERECAVLKQICAEKAGAAEDLGRLAKKVGESGQFDL